MFLPLLICITYVGQLTKGRLIISDKDYELLPPIYEMSNYQECHQKNYSYFRADIKLQPLNESDTIWKHLEETRKDKFLYNHDEIYRVICVPTIYQSSPKDVENFIAKFVREQINQVNLTPDVKKITPKDQYVPRFVDRFLKFTLIGYLCLIFGVTYYDIRKGKPLAKENILMAFSLRRNYARIFSISKGSHYQNLKCIQGLRTITCILIIWTHTKISFLTSFIEDTKYIENLYYEMLYVHYIFDLFLTQIFSLISAWLLTVQVLSIFEENKKFTVKDALIILINRIFRLWSVLLLCVIYLRKAVIIYFVESPLMDVIDMTIRDCEKYWWYSLLFIQNIKCSQVCNEGYWFVSTDMQLYLGGLILLYFALKFHAIKRMLGISLFLSYGLFGLIIYLNNLDVTFRFDLENIKWHKFGKDINFLYLYKMPYVTMSTYIMGICFGTFYYKHGQSENKKIASSVWVLSFLGFPTLAVAIASKEFNGFSAALIGPLLKPMYSFGIGMGILGMSQSVNGIMKKMLEWRPLEFLSQFTYSTYMSHFVIVFLRTAMKKPLTISNFQIIIRSGIQDVFLGFMVGFIIYLIIELPWSNIQKMYLPQVKKRSIKDE